MTYPYNTKAAAVGTDKVGPTFWDERVTDPLNELLVELGASPSGSAASVTVRLDEEHNQDGTHAGGIALGTGDIPVLGDYLAVAGDTMEGLLNLSSYYLTGMSYSVGIGYNALEGASYKTQVGTKENPPLVPVVTTTQRGDVTATNGLFLYNDTTNKFELYENGSWVSFLPLAGGTITSTETGGGVNDYVQLGQDYTIDPGADASDSYYIGHKIEAVIDADNTQPVGNVRGLVVLTGLNSDVAVAGADGIMSSLSNHATTGNIKGGWLHNVNYTAVSGFFYGLQANVDNWSTGGLTGSIYRARAGRFRLQNRAQATGGGTANMTTAEVIYANIANGGDVAVAATIGTAAGFYYDLTNDAYGTITTSYGVYLATPVNNGTITNHYGLYLANQSGIGGTDNFAIYSGGGINYFAGDVGIGETVPDAPLCVNQGAADTAILTLKSSDVAHGMTTNWETDTYACFGKLQAVAGGLLIEGISDADGGAGLALVLRGVVGEAVDTTKSADGVAALHLEGAVKSGTSFVACGADGNVVVIGNYGTTRFIFDAEGEMHSDAIIGVGDDWDEWDDLALAADLSRLPKAKFNEMMKYQAEDFERAGLLTLSTDEDGNRHAFLRHKALLQFYACCFAEVGQRLERYEQVLLGMGIQPELLEARA